MSSLAIPVGRTDHSAGPGDAVVTLVEYGDYQCSYCGALHPVLKAVRSLMGDKLRFVFRNFPLIEIHPHALAAAQLAEGAAEIGRFWTAHDLLFENQAALGEIDLFDFGERVGLDSSAVSRALDGRFDERIRGDFLGGVRSGVNGTPCLFINGSRYDGRNELDALIDALGKAAVQSRRAS